MDQTKSYVCKRLLNQTSLLNEVVKVTLIVILNWLVLLFPSQNTIQKESEAKGNRNNFEDS